MTIQDLNGEVVLLARAEIRTVGSTADAALALANGFRADVVLLGASVCDAHAAAFARERAADPARAAILVLAVSDEGDRLRLTCLSDDLCARGLDEELGGLLTLLEDLCDVPRRLAG